MVIVKGETSSIAATLTEKGFNTSTCYLELTSRFDGTTYGATVSDVSAYPDRYNLFNVYFDINPSQYNYNFISHQGGTMSYEKGRCVVTGTNSSIYY